MPDSLDKPDYAKLFPYYFSPLRFLGMETPEEQVALYAICCYSVAKAYSPYKQVYYLKKWINETDSGLKTKYSNRGNLHWLEKLDQAAVKDLTKSVRRCAYFPIGYVVIEVMRMFVDRRSW